MRAFLTVVSTILIVMSAATAQQLPDVTQPPTWHLGDMWTYTGYQPSHKITQTVLGATDTGYVVEVRDGPARNTLQFDKNLVSQHFWLTVPHWPLTPGEGNTWSFTRTSTNGNSFRTTERATSWDTVQVPAGTFQAVHVAGEECSGSSGRCGSFDWWYAPEVKWYVKESWSDSSFWSESVRGRSDALVSYTLH